MRSQMRGAARYGKWNALFAPQVSCTGSTKDTKKMSTTKITKVTKCEPHELREPPDPGSRIPNPGLRFLSWTTTNASMRITQAWG